MCTVLMVNVRVPFDVFMIEAMLLHFFKVAYYVFLSVE